MSVPSNRVFVLSAPKPMVISAVVFEMLILPEPASEPKESLEGVSQVAPLAMNNGTVSAMRSAAVLMIFPWAMVSGPVKVLAPPRNRLPFPDLVRPPVPLMTPSIRKALAVKIVAPPPAKLKVKARAAVVPVDPGKYPGVVPATMGLGFVKAAPV